MHDSNTGRKLAGVLGFFDDPKVLLQAMEKVRDAKFQSFDAFTPYPIHGMDQAQGLKRSKLPWVTLIMALTGCAAAFGLQYWTSVIDWPINVGGKPFNSWPAFVPVMFELTVLFGGVSTAIGLFVFCKLPNVTRRAFDPSLTRDRFAIIIEAPQHDHSEDDSDAGGGRVFSTSDARDFLQKVGAKDVREVFNEGWF